MKHLIFTILLCVLSVSIETTASEGTLCFNEVSIAAFEYLSPQVNDMEFIHLSDNVKVAVVSASATGQMVINGEGTDFYKVKLSGHETRESDGMIIGRVDWIIKVSTEINTCQIKSLELLN